jgi:hypothetical protein
MYVGANAVPGSKAGATMYIGSWWPAVVPMPGQSPPLIHAGISTMPIGASGYAPRWIHGDLVALPAAYQPVILAKGQMTSAVLMYATHPPSLGVYATIIEVQWDVPTP